MLPEKSCAFVAFIDPLAAQACVKELTVSRTGYPFKGKTIKVGFSNADKQLRPDIAEEVTKGATRAVDIPIDTTTWTEAYIHTYMGRFGDIENVRIVNDKNCAFVHYTNIQAAIGAVHTLPTEAQFINKRVSYGKDRCAALTPVSGQIRTNPFSDTNYTIAGLGRWDPQMLQTPGKRVLYIGGLPKGATTEDLCNVIRGGILFSIAMVPQKSCAFATFVDPVSAETFLEYVTIYGAICKGRRLKVGWANEFAFTPEIVNKLCIPKVCRSLYINNISDQITEEQLRGDFSAYGEVEQITILHDKHTAFVNFAAILNAISAISGLNDHPSYRDSKIQFGKDRCSNMPRIQPGQLPAERDIDDKRDHSHRNNNMADGDHHGRTKHDHNAKGDQRNNKSPFTGSGVNAITPSSAEQSKFFPLNRYSIADILNSSMDPL